jgi:hypothetical protein
MEAKTRVGRKSMRRLTGIFCALALAGCVSSGTQVKESQLTSFQKGITTEQDVTRALGPPQAVSTSTFGGRVIRVIVYSGVSASPTAANFIPIVGIFAGGANAQASSVAFTFGSDGKMIQMTSSHSTTETRMGGASMSTTSN